MSESKSVKRVIDILNLFISDNLELGVSEIARKIGTNKSTITRVMSTLASGGLVTRSINNRKYRLGGKILELSEALLSKVDLRTIAAPFLRELHSKTNETVYLSIRIGDQRVVLDRIEGSYTVRPVIEVGQRFPLRAGAPGKMILAYLPTKVRSELLNVNNSNFPMLKAGSVSNQEKLIKELDKIHREGVAVSFGEIIESAAAVAAPVITRNGEILAALGVTGLITRFTPEKIKQYSILVKEVAAKLSKELGCQPSHT